MNHRGVSWGLGALIFFLLTPTVWAEMSDRQLRRTVKKADSAWGEGKTKEALELYGTILEETEPGSEHRPSALYAMAFVSLSEQEGGRDMPKAWESIQEFKSEFPTHPRTLELETLHFWVEEAAKAGKGMEALNQELDALKLECEAAKEEISGEAGDQVKSCEDKLSRTQRQLRGVREEVKKLTAELEKKEEALSKLKDAIVDGGR